MILVMVCIYTVWWLKNIWIIFHVIHGMSSFPLTFTPSFFRGVGEKPTNHGSWLISPDIRGGGCEALFIYPFTLLGQ